ncbi:FAD-dependent monooxygenase [Ochrobactrum sp. Q0168]|uniref:FAD-dependent monooxygenase n=1 Tax=Ochrobactrum sp. Q0168 TaxID=2793241 RepID=UPI0018ECAF8A|nr:FAD-dependent monooxygenase [Ochrobactrum sp. Q0168]
MIKTSVVIAGGGPVGMTLALELAKRGVDCLVVERNETTTKHPKMDITNGRSMELFRSLGIADELRAAAVPSSHRFDVSWITDFTGSELYRFAYPSVDEMRLKIRNTNDGTQSLEPAMRVSQVVIEPVLRAAIARHSQIEHRFQTRFESFEETDDGVTVTLQNLATDTIETVCCQYLVGCDGGGSQVRQSLGIEFEGKPRVMERFMTHFKSTEKELLMRWGVAWHYQSAYGTLIAQDDESIWTLHSRFPDGEVDDVDPRALLRRFVGRDIDAEILVANPWAPHLLVAESYGRGRVFIAGDAAHQYIPTGGYGMNTGIGDASNLGWKLAAVVKGFAGPALLNSYEAERLPVGIRNCAAAEDNNDVRRAIGSLYNDLLFAECAEGDAARAQASARIASLGNLENEAWGIEFGYVYSNSNAVIAEADANVTDDPAVYVPTTVPGARLPSIFLPDDTALFDHLGDWFTLLNFGPKGAGQYFIEAAETLGVPLKLVEVDAGDLAQIYEMPLILVRPDQHVAWRGHQVDNSVLAKNILKMILGRTGR